MGVGLIGLVIGLVSLFLVVSTSAIDCLERLVFKMYVEWHAKPYYH